MDTTAFNRDAFAEQLPALLVERPGILRDALLAKRSLLVESIRAVDSEVAAIQDEMRRKMEGVQERRRPLEDALTHLDAFLRAEGWIPCDEMVCPRLETGRSQPAVNAAYDLLSSLGEPLHYRKLAQALADKGIHIAGKDPAAVLLTQMSRDARFQRSDERGVYGLTSWDMRRAIRRQGKARSRRKADKRR